MATLICGETITDAWLADVEHLFTHGEQLNLVTTIADPTPGLADRRIIEEVDRWLLGAGKQRVDTVASTIFPTAFLAGRASRQEFYDRYLDVLPRLRRLKGNEDGTYFGRLIDYPATADVKRGSTINQIELGVIQKLRTQLRSRGAKRFAYQAQIFAPGRDDTSQMGFPCLMFVSFQLFQRRLCLTATYRNQYYFERALGNFIGLARLQEFVAGAVAIDMGRLTVHACHAEIDALSKQNAKQMIQVCRGIASAATLS